MTAKLALADQKVWIRRADFFGQGRLNVSSRDSLDGKIEMCDL